MIVLYYPPINMRVFHISMRSVGETSRSRLSPVGETSGLDVPVARGPVPRERWIARGMARDRPSPYGEGAFFIVARGPVPRVVHRQEVAF